MTEPANPSAFPFVLPPRTDGGMREDWGEEGMTLRDYLAAAALNGFCSSKESLLAAGGADDMADLAYAYADGMLKAREKEPEAKP